MTTQLEAYASRPGPTDWEWMASHQVMVCLGIVTVIIAIIFIWKVVEAGASMGSYMSTGSAGQPRTSPKIPPELSDMLLQQNKMLGNLGVTPPSQMMMNQFVQPLPSWMKPGGEFQPLRPPTPEEAEASTRRRLHLNDCDYCGRPLDSVKPGPSCPGCGAPIRGR